jgi:organic hydroperoxide reductase OsmC/OhrA
MSQYTAIVEWKRGNAPFTDNRYSRGHTWRFDGGVEVPASSAPSVVPLPLSVAAAVDPEEAFVASLSSCHMLTFLYIAAKRGFVIDDYRDEAIGLLEKDERGGRAMTRVTLRPAIHFIGARQPTPADIDTMHHEAHEQCFIARSVKTDVRVEPAAAPGEGATVSVSRSGAPARH